MPAAEDVAGRPCPRVEGEEAVRERCADLLRDESKLSGTGAERVYLPEGARDVVSALREANSGAEPVTLSGGRTGIVGGAVPVDSRWVLSFSRMSRLFEVSVDEATGEPCARVEAGMSLAALAEGLASFEWSGLPGEAGSRRWFYPVDPTEATALAGGTVATNASGARSYRYGPTRAWVRGLGVVFADGSPARIRRGEVRARGGVLEAPALFGGRRLDIPVLQRPACKCSCGYYVEPDVDLVDLLVGSEGTLCAITEVEFRLASEPAHVLSLMCFLPEGRDGLALVKALRGDERLSPLAIEYFGGSALELLREDREISSDDRIPELPAEAGSAVFLEEAYDIDDLDERVAAIDECLAAHGGSLENTWAGDDPATREKMRLLRHSVPEAVNNRVARRKLEVPELHKVGTDIAVPDSALEELLAAYRELLPGSGLEHVLFGHAGENHLHANLIPRTAEELERAKALHEDLARLAVRLGGAATAEHGVGRLKRSLLSIQYGPEGVEGLRRVKEFFDPRGLLNPGVLFPA